MKRRDLIKTGLLGLGAAAVAVSGCNKDESVAESGDFLNIEPKQTGVYEFSIPLPFNYEVIDKLAELNNRFKKSQIKTMYNSFPLPLSSNYNSWIQINRGHNPNVHTYEDYKNFIKYAQSKGFKYCHLMNSAKALSEKDYKQVEHDFHFALDFLHDLGVNDIKFANTQVGDLINEYKYKFDLSSSTVTNYANISQYKHLMNNYPNIKLFDIAIDQNQNFTFLKALRTAFPDIKLEIMVNEPCIKGCPGRTSHEGETFFTVYECFRAKEKQGTILTFFKTSAIYPWNLPYYSALGINNFKFMPEGNADLRANFHNIQLLTNYLSCVENGVDEFSANTFFNNMFNAAVPIDEHISLASIMPFLPDVEHFVQNGHKCRNNCDIDCFYCNGCARKLQEFISYA